MKASPRLLLAVATNSWEFSEPRRYNGWKCIKKHLKKFINDVLRPSLRTSMYQDMKKDLQLYKFRNLVHFLLSGLYIFSSPGSRSPFSILIWIQESRFNTDPCGYWYGSKRPGFRGSVYIITDQDPAF